MKTLKSALMSTAAIVFAAGMTVSAANAQQPEAGAGAGAEVQGGAQGGVQTPGGGSGAQMKGGAGADTQTRGGAGADAQTRGGAGADARTRGGAEAKGKAESRSGKRDGKDDGRAMKDDGKDGDRARKGDDRERGDRAKGDDREYGDRDKKDRDRAGRDRSGGERKAKFEERHKTKIKQYFSKNRVSVKSVDVSRVSVSIGTAVPAFVALHPLPSAVLVDVPADCPYQYFVLGRDIVIVDSCSRSIVEIIVGVA